MLDRVHTCCIARGDSSGADKTITQMTADMAIFLGGKFSHGGIRIVFEAPHTR